MTEETLGYIYIKSSELVIAPWVLDRHHGYSPKALPNVSTLSLVVTQAIPWVWALTLWSRKRTLRREWVCEQTWGASRPR